MKIVLRYLSREKGVTTRDIEVDMNALVDIRFVFDDDQHIDISPEEDRETKGLHLLSRGQMSVHPGASNAISITSKWDR